jgi:hypothetical protein
MRRFLPHLLWASGLILVIVGFVIVPVVRDGTPEMDLLSERQSEPLCHGEHSWISAFCDWCALDYYTLACQSFFS